MKRTVEEWQNRVNELRMIGEWQLWERRIMELRGWITKNGRHIFIGDSGKGGGGVDKSAKSGIIEIENDETKGSNKMDSVANNVIVISDLPEIASNAHPRNEKLEEIIKKCIEQEHPVFADDLKTYFLKIPKEKGKYILALHGTPNNVFLYDEQADVKALANIIRNRADYKNEDTIVLISCNTGNTTNVKTCFAQKLSNEMNKIILAPTEYGVITAQGEYFSGNKNFIKSGEFKEFKPEKEELV